MVILRQQCYSDETHSIRLPDISCEMRSLHPMSQNKLRNETKVILITTADRNKGKYNKRPYETERKYVLPASRAGDRVKISVIFFCI